MLPERRCRLFTTLPAGNTTGDPYVRAGDKTGSGDFGTRNAIAVVWPLVIAVQSDRGRPGAASDDELIAEATRAVLKQLR
ncbi:hypothetical protein [Actinoplanes sp. G11-F43]|uniref:hypothetical protein n=1 Tax=Actinoplanes sp. G11-F43 TaxID=3424130 RepID=UPI003D34314F